MNDSHPCPARGCEKQVSIDQLACRPHWFSLPPELRRRVGRAWRAIQNGDHTAIRAHAAAAAEARRILRA